jgi:hypothetical protein
MARRSTVAAHGVLRVLVAILLLAAAGLKAHQLATEPTAEGDLWSHRWFLILWVEVELALGLWLASGLARRAAWGVALACFAGFAAIALYKGISGETSCGCFGRIEVNPWHTLILDVVVAAALLLFRPPLRVAAPATYFRVRFAATAAIGLAAGIPVALAAALYAPAGLSADGEVTGDQRVVLLEPEKWVGTKLPLLKHIDIGGQFAKGRWTVVLYHHDCPHCQERVPQFEQEARRQAGRLVDARVAMVELAPYAPPGKNLLPPDTTCTKGRVSDVRDWFVETPTILTLVDGVVVDAKEGDQAKGPSPARLAGLTPVAGEKAVSLPEGGYDFGFVEPKSAHKVLLTVQNPSKKPLTIARIRSECKCMSAVAAESAIAAGESAPVRVVLVAPEKPVLYNQRVLLQTDDPKNPVIPIRIKAAVGLPICTEPATVDFGMLAAGEEKQKIVTIANRASKKIGYITQSLSQFPDQGRRLETNVFLVKAGQAGKFGYGRTIVADVDARFRPRALDCRVISGDRSWQVTGRAEGGELVLTRTVGAKAATARISLDDDVTFLSWALRATLLGPPPAPPAEATGRHA